MRPVLKFTMRKIILYSLAAIFVAAPLSAAKAASIVTEAAAGIVQTTTVTLVWDANPEPDIAGYRVYYGGSSRAYTRTAKVTVPKARVSVRSDRTTYFAVTAYNTAGAESLPSAEVRWP